MTIHRKIACQHNTDFNTQILEKFLANQNNPEVKKSHLFDDRYENIYLTEKHIPELTALLDEAIGLAQDILQHKNLRAGYWFNYMPPDSTTTIHSHDDDDELLSAVYYVSVPENSGNLIIYPGPEIKLDDKLEISPQAGEFIFFKPNIRHEVTRNQSKEHRLSIGINFGPKS